MPKVVTPSFEINSKLSEQKRDKLFSEYSENNYSVHPLPIEAQFSPVFGMLANDYNNNGHADLLLARNSFDVNAETRKYAGAGSTEKQKEQPERSAFMDVQHFSTSYGIVNPSQFKIYSLT